MYFENIWQSWMLFLRSLRSLRPNKADGSKTGNFGLKINRYKCQFLLLFNFAMMWYGPGNCSILTVLVEWILYWPAFVWRWLPSKNKVDDERRSSNTKHCNLTEKFVCLWKCKFLSATLFLEDRQRNFSYQKKSTNECRSV